MTVKVECDCGQRYAFDVEPVGGAMPTAVSCPACGADGTAAANAYIAEHAPAKTAPASPSPGPIRIAAPAQGAPTAIRVAAPATAAAPSGPASIRVAAAPAPQAAPAAGPYRHVDKERAENEARAKILWGDDPKEVGSFLRSQGLSFEEANAMVQSLLTERAKTVRIEGTKKMFIGGALVLLPIVFFLGSLAAGRLPVRIFALTVLAGFYGLYQFVKGLLAFLAPKSESGNVFED